MHRLALLIAFTFCFASSLFARPYIQDTDLISLHYDHAPDRDDGHAAVAGLMVTTRFGIQPHVVSGAYGEGNAHRYVSAAEAVMEATWPGVWINAHSNRQNAINRTTDAWVSVINAGGNVYVAEGGQSDFTSDVIRRINDTTSINTKERITVVQHSDWNEEQASQSDLRYVRNNSTYERIDDGNQNNRTADLHRSSDDFVTQARRSEFSDAWNAAFAYLNPNTKLDFSDTVELLHILQIGRDRVATVNDFAAEFFSSNEVIIPDPTSATPWSDSYAVEGQCYCDSSYDHGLRSVTVQTPDGRKTVPQICDDINALLGNGPNSKRIYYNTVQCGHGPENNAADESTCPGIPRGNRDYTGSRCNETGPTWNLDLIYPSQQQPEPEPIPEPVEEPIPEPVEEPANEPVNDAPQEEVPADPVEEPQAAQPPPVSFPDCSDSVIDDNADGYGYENGQSCLIVSNSVEPAPATPSQPDEPAQPQPAGPIFPECSASVIDDNADGYGYENGQSCLISASPAPTTPSQPVEPTQPQPVGSIFPECSASVIDDNADGYGYENGQSCLIVSNPAPAPTTPSQPVATPQPQPTGQIFPQCSASVIDDNADGYGYENGQSCLISTSSAPTTPSQPVAPTQPQPAGPVFPECSAAVIDDNSDGYGYENGQSCLINPSNSLSTVEQPQADQPAPLAGSLFPVCSADVVDDNSDGYGFENGQSCLITSSGSIAPATPVQNVPPLSELFPECSTNIIDENSDGFGFENGQSCLITSSTTGAPVVPAQSEPTNGEPTLGDLFPECSANVIDDNTDGFGFENGQSCLITATAITAPTTPVQQAPGQSEPTLEELFPECSASVVDDNTDGFGFENGQSCLITATAIAAPTPTVQQAPGQSEPTLEELFPECSASVVDENFDGFGFENGQSCLISASAKAATPVQPAQPLANLPPELLFPECSASVVDDNADGYGFENNQTCIVAATR